MRKLKEHAPGSSECSRSPPLAAQSTAGETRNDRNAHHRSQQANRSETACSSNNACQWREMTPETPDELRSQCLVQLVSGRWTLAVLAELSADGRRYQDLYDALRGISYKVLTETLRRAERDGLLSRHLDPVRVETATLYQLTDVGRSLEGPLSVLASWVDANWNFVEAARRSWDGRTKNG